MGIISEACAEESNKIRKIWVKELKEAIASGDMSEVVKVVDGIEKYYFSE